ncbi:MAG: hypothetical protein VB036_11760 [Propionicimonas sp.]|nr:hypothetical protein [Propionicimonas sp.]
MMIDYPYYSSVQELAAASNLIVEVTVGDAHPDLLRPAVETAVTDPARNPQAGLVPSESQAGEADTPITVHATRVDAVHRGTTTVGATIEVKQMGGVLNGVRYSTDEAQLETGKSYLLFLETYPNSPASILGGDVGMFVRDRTGRSTSLGQPELTVDAAILASLG